MQVNRKRQTTKMYVTLYFIIMLNIVTLKVKCANSDLLCPSVKYVHKSTSGYPVCVQVHSMIYCPVCCTVHNFLKPVSGLVWSYCGPV